MTLPIRAPRNASVAGRVPPTITRPVDRPRRPEILSDSPVRFLIPTHGSGESLGQRIESKEIQGIEHVLHERRR